MSPKRCLLALVPILFLLVGGVSDAQSERPERRERGARMDRIVEKLDLSEVQRDALEELMDSRRGMMRGHHEEMMRATERLETEIKSDIFDENAIRSAASDVAALREDAAVERAQMRQELAKILSPEQLERFEEMQHRRGGKEQRPQRRPARRRR